MKISTPEVKCGLTPGFLGSRRVSRTISWSFAATAFATAVVTSVPIRSTFLWTLLTAAALVATVIVTRLGRGTAVLQ